MLEISIAKIEQFVLILDEEISIIYVKLIVKPIPRGIALYDFNERQLTVLVIQARNNDSYDHP